MMEMKKLRHLQIESMVQSERGYLLTFAIIAVTTKVIIIVGIIFALQAYWIQFDDYDIENSRQMFYKHWISETTRKEEISGIATIDFTYREGNHNKLAVTPETNANNEKILRSNLIKLPIWFNFIHFALGLIVTAGTLHATICWYFTLQPIPSILLDFCTYDLELCRRQCDTSLNEEYPLIVSNDLELVAKEVQASFNSYLSILDDKLQKLKWTMLSVCFSYILLLSIAFISPFNSFFRQVIWAKNREWTCTRLQQRLYLFLDVASVTVIILLYFGISVEYIFVNKFNLKLKECRQQLDFCLC
ncbi:unnamed protein product [Acanthocheilonema viteae]|uniref:Uncharacterized protein n=1 Tax=Acanthocheilonema viteae TaxID=6277 RepID=A0A498S2X6_ACAVI|nr:unnamed protein product [Acanthocheilonema viteae]